MATSMTSSFTIPTRAHVASSGRTVTVNRRRRITPQAGHALEILGHAIEYLTDEYVNEGGTLPMHSERLEAVQMLMERNRQIYFSCPEVPTLGERLHTILKLRSA